MSKENLVKEIIRTKLSEAGMSSKFRKAVEEYKEVSLKLQYLYADRAKALEGYKKADGAEKEKYKNELSRIQKLVSPLQAQMEKAERVFNKALLSEPEELEETIDDDGMERVAAGLPQTEEEPVSEATADAIAKDLDKVKGELLKKVAELVAKKKKLYSNVDISSPMSAEEKKLDKEIADAFSQINQLVKQRRDVKTESVTEAKFKHINTGEKTINKKVMDKVKETFPTMKSVKKKNVPNMGEVLYIHDGDGNGIGQVYVDKQHGVVIDVKEGVSEALNTVAGEWVLFKTMGSFSKPSRKMKFVSLQKSHRSAQIAMKKALDKMNRSGEEGGYGIMSKDKWDKEDSRFKVESVSESINEENTTFNKWLLKYIDNYLRGGVFKPGSPKYLWAFSTLFQHALTDANFHEEAKKVSSLFKKAEEPDNASQLDNLLMYKGADVARKAKWDGFVIIDGFAYVSAMRNGGATLQPIKALKNESVSEGKNDKKIKELEAKLAAVKGKTPGDEGRRAAIRDDIERLKAESVSEARRPPDDWYAEVLQDAIISKLKGKAVNGWKMGIDLELGTFKYTKNGFDFVVYITPFEEEDRFITVSAYDYESEEVDYLQGALGKYKHPLNPTYDVDKDVSKYISFVTKLLTKVEKAHKLNTESVNEGKNDKKIKELEAKLAKVKGKTPGDEGIRAAIRDDIERLKAESVSEGKKFGSKYDIGMGRMGSGVTVWNRLQKQGGDYKTIAHISDAGKVSFRDKSLPDDVKKYIEDYAKKGMNEMVNEASKRANEFFGDSKHGQEIHKMLKGKWDAKKVDGYLEELGGGSIQKNLRIIDFITKAAGLNPRKYDTQTLGKQISDLLNTLEVLYKDFANATNVKKFDDVRIKSKNLIGMVYAISGNTLVVKTANGLVKATKDDVEPVLSDGVMKEGNAFGMAVTQAKKDGKKEFEFNGKTYKVKKGSIEENEKETISESDGVKKNESVNEVDYNSALASFNAELGENEAVKKIASYYAVSVKIVVNNLQSKIKVSRYSDKSIKSIDIDFTETETKIKVKHSKQFKNEVNVNESDCGCGAKVVVSEAVNVRKLLQMNVARELKVSPSSIEVGVGGYGSRTANDGSQVVVIGLDSNVKKISIPQADYFDKTVDYGGYLIVKADGKTGKLLKVLDRVKSQNDIRMMDYIKEVNENITEAVKEPEVITKLRDIVNRRGYATIKDPVTKKNVKVDTFSASAIIQVYDAVNDTNKQKLAALSIPKMASVAFKLAK